ncbi:MAG: DALR domain-containing protein, partial [Thermoplasmatota archaeon]
VTGDASPEAEAALRAAAATLSADFEAAMDDDLHTPLAVAALFAFQREVHRILEKGGVGAAAAEAKAALERTGRLLGLFGRPARSAGKVDALALLLGVPAGSEGDVMDRILVERENARLARDWGRADRIRSACLSAGYAIEDTPAGPRWRPA